MAAGAFGLGAIVGSFLNVVIHRYPLGESIVFPSSRCPRCLTAILPYDNVPVLSWIILGGKCRRCRAPIALRYPLVELANGLFYLALFLFTGVSWAFPLVAAIVSMTIVLIYIDLDIQILPDVVDLPGIAIGIVIGVAALGRVHVELALATSWSDSLVGAALGGLIIIGINLAYRLIRGVDGMGMGDAKMLAMIGAVSGWRMILPVLFLSSMAGAVFGVAMALRAKEKLDVAIPFGVFLGLGFLTLLFFGAKLFDWYVSILAV
jgi:leader peptidase (prepilin peptidase)/N-methyltransferase